MQLYPSYQTRPVVIPVAQSREPANQVQRKFEIYEEIFDFMRKFSTRLRWLKESHAEELAKEITETDESRRMFEAVCY